MQLRTTASSWIWLTLAILAGVPAMAIRLGAGPVSEGAAALLFGSAIAGAAFLLVWASEVLALDIPQTLALGLVALIAVLPEYAVDLYFVWQAGADPQSEYASFAAANMTGANRLLVGIGWPLVALLYWFRRRRGLRLERSLLLELGVLGIATVYSFSIFLKSSIALGDAAVLIGIFCMYVWSISRGRRGEPELVGPSAAIGSLAPPARRGVIIFLFAYAALVIILSAAPFAEGLIATGRDLGIEEFLLVQWVAPLASESPEIIIAVVLTLRGAAGAAMIALISAKVNQWTLLVGSLPVVYSISLGTADSLPLDSRQQEEFLLTSAQSLFAVLLLLRMRVSWQGAVALLVLFSSQLAIPDERARLIFAFIYLGAAAALLVIDAERRREVLHMGHAVMGSLLRRRG